MLYVNNRAGCSCLNARARSKVVGGNSAAAFDASGHGCSMGNYEHEYACIGAEIAYHWNFAARFRVVARAFPLENAS